MSENLPQTIGIDISKASLDCHAYPAGTGHQFANTAKGHKALIACHTRARIMARGA